MKSRRRPRRRLARRREIAYTSATVVIGPITKEDATMLTEAVKSAEFGAHDWETFPDVGGPGEHAFHAYFEDGSSADTFRDWVNSEFE